MKTTVLTGKLKNEAQTVEAMIKIYCRRHHASSVLCQSCQELRDFSFFRLSKCPYAENKPNCKDCSIHCYKGKKDLRAELRIVMREIGPLMPLYHPIMSFRHLLQGLKKNPNITRKKSSTKHFTKTTQQ